MAKDTFQGWATPVSIPGVNKLADHTFVYCTNKNSYFTCMGSSDMKAADTVLCVTSSGSKAFCKADKYRGNTIGISEIPFMHDSAHIKYLLTGLCHQAANRFLYATDGPGMIPPGQRPRGTLGTYALYGTYGSDFPLFLTIYYSQAYGRCLFAKMDVTTDKIIDTGSLSYKIVSYYQEQYEKGELGSNHIVNEMEIIINHCLGREGVSPIRKEQTEILKEMDEMLMSYSLTKEQIEKKDIHLSKADIRNLTDKINNYSISIQDQLRTVLGNEQFLRLNGDDNFYLPANYEIAVEVLSNL